MRKSNAVPGSEGTPKQVTLKGIEYEHIRIAGGVK